MDYQSEATKEEFYLEINDFQKIDTISGLYAVARLVQTLCILEPGTYPNHPDMGIGIKNFKFEYADAPTISSIQRRINEQISKYLSDANITSVDVELIMNEHTKKKDKLVVNFNLSNNKDFILSFEESEKTGKIISNIYI